MVTEEKEEIEALILKLGGVYKPDMARGNGNAPRPAYPFFHPDARIVLTPSH